MPWEAAGARRLGFLHWRRVAACAVRAGTLPAAASPVIAVAAHRTPEGDLTVARPALDSTPVVLTCARFAGADDKAAEAP